MWLARYSAPFTIVLDVELQTPVSHISGNAGLTQCLHVAQSLGVLLGASSVSSSSSEFLCCAVAMQFKTVFDKAREANMALRKSGDSPVKGSRAPSAVSSPGTPAAAAAAAAASPAGPIYQL